MTVSAADVAALASVGLRAARPLVATVVVAMPPVRDPSSVVATPAVPAPVVRRSTVLCHTRRRLLDDLRRRAAGSGAVGIGGIAFGVHRLPDVARMTGWPLVELTATGVPLLAPGQSDRVATCFRTTLSAADIATLIGAGWMPADVLVADDMRVRSRTDAPADAQVVTSRSNAEIPGGTRMVTAARSAVRETLRKLAASLGADGLLVGPIETYWSSTRHCIQVVARGDAIVRWRDSSAGETRPRAVIDVGAMGQ